MKEKGDRKAEREMTERAIQVDNNSVDAWAYLANAIKEPSGEEAMVKEIEELANAPVNSKCAAPYIALQGFFAGDGKDEKARDKAIGFAKKAVERAPGDALALLCLSALYGQAGKIDEVVKLLAPHEALMQRDVRLAHNYFEALFQLRDLQKITALLNKLATSQVREVKQFAIERSRAISQMLAAAAAAARRAPRSRRPESGSARGEGDLEVGAPSDAPGEAREEVGDRRLEPVLGADGSVRALDVVLLFEDARGPVGPLAAHVPADVARGDADLRVVAEALDLVRRPVGEDDEAPVERRGPDGRLHAGTVLAKRLEAHVALVGERRFVRHDRGVSHPSPRGEIERSQSAAAVGTTTANVAPLPASLSTSTRAPIASLSRFTTASPSPTPPYWRSAEPSTCRNSSKMRAWSAGGDADAGVLHLDAHGARSLAPRRDDDAPALGRELRRVRQQVEEHLLERARIGLDLRQVRADVGLDRERLGPDHPARRRHHGGHQLADVDRLRATARACRRRRATSSSRSSMSASSDRALRLIDCCASFCFGVTGP